MIDGAVQIYSDNSGKVGVQISGANFGYGDDPPSITVDGFGLSIDSGYWGPDFENVITGYAVGLPSGCGTYDIVLQTLNPEQPGTAMSTVYICVGSAVSVSLDPADVTGDPGDSFDLTATVTPPVAGSFQWQLTPRNPIQDGDNPSAFKFVSQPSCTNQPSCVATVQGVSADSTGFVQVQVTFTPSGPPLTSDVRKGGARDQQAPAVGKNVTRLIAAPIKKISSDQFPNGPVANYLPADGTPGTGVGAGLIGNARGLLLVGARDSGVIAMKASVEPSPNNQESIQHIWVGSQPGGPRSNSGSVSRGNWVGMDPNSPDPNNPGKFTRAVFSMSIPPYDLITLAQLPPAPLDYSIVSGTINKQDPQTVFSVPCLVQPPANTPLCSNGAVRGVSQALNVVEKSLVQSGAFVSQLLYPVAASFLNAFTSPWTAPVDDPINAPPLGDANIGIAVRTTALLDTSSLYFNVGMAFQANPTLYQGQVFLYTFDSHSGLANRIRNDSDFQQILTDTLAYHAPDVRTYFISNSSAQFAIFTWPVLSCWTTSLNPTACSGQGFDPDPSKQVDQPPIFPCATLSGKECTFGFSDPDFARAFGRVGYSVASAGPLMITVTVTRSGNNLVVAQGGASITGSIYDVYQWNSQAGFGSMGLANIQASFSANGEPGRVFLDVVQLDANPLFGFTYVF